MVCCALLALPTVNITDGCEPGAIPAGITAFT
jgi:hypothetical protein